MPHRQQDTLAQKTPFTNFLPLLAVIRADLGTDWPFYEEFLENVVDAASHGKDSSAWYEQMEALVGDQPSLRFSHEGVCVLLRGLEGRAQEALVSADRSRRHGAPVASMGGDQTARCLTSRSRDVGVGLMLPPSSVRKAGKPSTRSSISPDVSSTLPSILSSDTSLLSSTLSLTLPSTLPSTLSSDTSLLSSTLSSNPSILSSDNSLLSSTMYSSPSLLSSTMYSNPSLLSSPLSSTPSLLSSTLSSTPPTTPAPPPSHPTSSSEDDFDPTLFTDLNFQSEISRYFHASETPDQANHGVAETGDGCEEPAYFAEDDDLEVWKKHFEDGDWL